MLQEMFNKAANPHRVFVGAVQQLYTDLDEACWRPGKSLICLFDTSACRATYEAPSAPHALSEA